MIRLGMKNWNMILIKKLQKSPLSSRKVDKYEYLKGVEILPSDESRITEQAKFIYSPLGKAKTSQSNWRAMKKTSWSFKSFKTKGKSTRPKINWERVEK